MPTLELQDVEAAELAIRPLSPGTRFRYGLTILAGAFLLFQIQLIIGKYILPWFGGTPAVWTTCLLFFQLLLLGGYLYAHILTVKLSGRSQTIVHLSLLGLSVVLIALETLFWHVPLLPGRAWRPRPSELPIPQILILLATAVGLPYLCLSTTAPLLQKWFGRANPRISPYRLYALSNIGSLLGLITYPFVFEPESTLHSQAWFWSAAYILFVLGTVACASDSNAPEGLPSIVADAPVFSPTVTAQALWFLLPAFASLMLLATTNLMCQEVAVVPFLWVLPLTMYLISFIICFDNQKWYRRGLFQTLLGAALPMAVAVLLSPDTASIEQQVGMLSLVLFACCMVCHGELVRLKPHPQYLTRFYLSISAGGAAGGFFVAIIAPQIFTGFWEFHFGLVGCFLVAILAVARDRESWWYFNKPYLAGAILLGLFLAIKFVARYSGLAAIPDMMYRWQYYPLLTLLAVSVGFVTLRGRNRPLRYRRFSGAQFASLVVVATLSAALFEQVKYDENLAIRRDRNFYAALMIKQGPGMHSIELRHGQTLHGFQLQDRPKEPTAYYSRQSGIGLLLDALAARSPQRALRYGFIGLGVGTLAAYGRPSDVIRYYELNPQVIAYSSGKSPYFTFVRDSLAKVTIVPGDARLSLEREFSQNGSQNFDVLVVDAFSSDSIPVHLLAQEAFEIYLENLRGPESIMAFHISNRMLDLSPVLATLAAHNHLAAIRLCKEHSSDLGEHSDWIFLSRDPKALAAPSFQGHLDTIPPPNPALLWTDDYSNLFRVLRTPRH